MKLWLPGVSQFHKLPLATFNSSSSQFQTPGREANLENKSLQQGLRVPSTSHPPTTTTSFELKIFTCMKDVILIGLRAPPSCMQTKNIHIFPLSQALLLLLFLSVHFCLIQWTFVFNKSPEKGKVIQYMCILHQCNCHTPPPPNYCKS